MIKEVNTYNFNNEIFIPNIPVIVYFWAPWCGPCKMVSPILKSLSQELSSQVKFVKINIDSNPIIAQNFNISSIPTILIFKDGKIQQTITGFLPKQKIKKIIHKVLK